MLWKAEVTDWGLQKEGEDRRKKKDGITFPYCMWSRIHHLGEPDVRHSHQTFQIKGPPHPSTPLSNPLSISFSLTNKSLRTFTHMHTHPVHIYSLTSSSSFFQGNLLRGLIMMFCNSRVALGCKTHLRAARRSIVGYLIWCEKGWWMLFACCIDVQIAVWMLPQQGRAVIVWLASKQVYQMISALAHFTILGETAWARTIKTSPGLYIHASPTPPPALLSNVRMRACLCVQVPRPLRLLHFMTVIC